MSMGGVLRCAMLLCMIRALKRQTDSQAEAYIRLMEENSQFKVWIFIFVSLRYERLGYVFFLILCWTL